MSIGCFALQIFQRQNSRIDLGQAVRDELCAKMLPFISLADGIDTTSYRDAMVAAGHLCRNDPVNLVNYGFHSFVYVGNRRWQGRGPRRRPIVGKTYSIWYDRYRRPFRFAHAGARAVAEAWLQRYLAAGGDAGVHAHRLVTFLEAGLLRYSQRRYTTVDLFLRDVHGYLVQQWNAGFVDSPEEKARIGAQMHGVVRDCFNDIVHHNTMRPLCGREWWPLTETQPSLDSDTTLGFFAENQALRGSPYAFEMRDVLPRGQATRKIGVRGAEAESFMKWALQSQEQPIRHEALRAVFASLIVGKMYMDERLQRNLAVPADVVDAKASERFIGQAAHDAAVRAQALAALQAPTGVKNPVVAAVVERQRAAARAAIAEQKHFPVFANVPWQVTLNEAQRLQRQHVAIFSPTPHPQARPREANCNSTVYALLNMAAAEQTRLHPGAPAPRLLGGTSYRSLGAGRPVQLAHPHVVESFAE